MSFTLIAIYIAYILLGISLKTTFLRNHINKLKNFSDELYDFISKVLLFLGASGLIVYVILTYN